jgi:hypothetical protein
MRRRRFEMARAQQPEFKQSKPQSPRFVSSSVEVGKPELGGKLGFSVGPTDHTGQVDRVTFSSNTGGIFTLSTRELEVLAAWAKDVRTNRADAVREFVKADRYERKNILFRACYDLPGDKCGKAWQELKRKL